MGIGGKYNWLNQDERLTYIGKVGAWHQFELVDKPGKVWCEVLEEDLNMIEATKQATEKAVCTHCLGGICQQRCLK